MPELAIGITCAPRGAVEYTTRSLESLRAAGFAQRVYAFAEPETTLGETSGLQIIQNSERLGCYRNFSAGLQWLCQNTTADWLLMLQDDVQWRDDAAARLQAGIERWNQADIGVLSPYCSAAMAGRPCRFRRMEAWHDAIFYNRAFWGALALCFPRAAAQALLRHPRWKTHKHHRKVDVLVGNVLKVELGLRVLVYAPSLATHIGAISTLGRHKIKGIAWGRTGLRFREKA